MWPTSAQYKERIKQSHGVSSRVEVLDQGVVVANLIVERGQVQMDAGADIQRQVTCTVMDPSGLWTPSDLTDLLAPNGNELRVWRGIYMPGIPFQPDSLIEEIPQGDFGIYDVDATSNITGGSKLVVVAYDRGKRIQEAKFDAPYVIAAGTNYGTAIQNLIRDRLSGTTLSFRFEGTNATTPLLVFKVGDDPWKAVRDMAYSIGMEVFFDGLGVVVMRTVPNPDTSPVVWTYAEGSEAMILTASRKMTREFTYNGVIASGESTAILDQATAPVTWTAWDTNPESPTYYLGKFGKKPREYVSSFIVTPAQARSAAEAMLNLSKGVAENVRFSAIVNPAHEPGDVIEITVAGAKIAARYVLDSFSVPLTQHEHMMATTRRRTA